MSVDNPFNNPTKETLEPVVQNSEQLAKNPTEEEQLQQWLEDHPTPEVAPDELLDYEQEITRFEEAIASFEAEYSLEALHSIIDLRPEDVSQYPLREAAKAALIPIVKQLNSLIGMRPGECEKLKEKYMKLSRAVGIINNNKVDHNR